MARYQSVHVLSDITENNENLQAILKSSTEAWLSKAKIIKHTLRGKWRLPKEYVGVGSLEGINVQIFKFPALAFQN